MTSLPNALHAWQTAGFAQALKAEIEPLGAAKIGVFFTEIVASCGCGAEPMEQNAYCEMRLRIAKATAEAALSVPADQAACVAPD